MVSKSSKSLDNGKLTGRHTASNRGKQAGRALMVVQIDELLAEPQNLKHLREQMQLAYEIDPLAFVERFGYPLLPKQQQIDLNTGGEPLPIRIRYPDIDTEE